VSYEYEPHRPVKWRPIPWMVCKLCGLVYLNNDLSRRAIRLGCDYHEHKGYQQACKNAG
jgi:hypothetical protein